MSPPPNPPPLPLLIAPLSAAGLAPLAQLFPPPPAVSPDRLRPPSPTPLPATGGGGLAVLAALCLHPPAISHDWLVRGIVLLAPGVVIGELVPIKIPRRGEDEAITFSTTFAFALLLVAGPLAAA